MEEAATHEDPDNSSGNGGTSRQSPAADGSVAVAEPSAGAADAESIELPV